MRKITSRSALALCIMMSPLLLAARGEGCGGGAAGQDVLDVSGGWSLSWHDDLVVEIAIGGAVYHETLGAQGGVITIDHDGQPITFELDCSRDEVVCPSEVWPTYVELEQRNARFPRNVYVTIPKSTCDGDLVEPEPSECGPNTNNEECERVCTGTVTQADGETFGLLSADGTELTTVLGGDIATNGVNCALLGLSIAHNTFETAGSKEDGDWQAVSIPDGDVITAYAGGCLWAGDVDDDGAIEALVIGASVKLTTSFTGERR